MIAEWTKDWATKNINYQVLSQTGSTNDVAKESYLEISYPHLIISDQQTKGRGRGSNEWQNLKSGSALFSTWCFKSDTHFPPILSPKIGLALYGALQQTWPDKNFSIKPPNDIYLEDKKIAGILLESISSTLQYLFIGIGINVLDRPTLEIAGCIDAHTQSHTWQQFLDFFWMHLSHIDFQQNTLSSNDRKILKQASQNHFSEAIKEINENGDIILTNKTISWLDL